MGHLESKEWERLNYNHHELSCEVQEENRLQMLAEIEKEKLEKKAKAAVEWALIEKQITRTKEQFNSLWYPIKNGSFYVGENSCNPEIKTLREEGFEFEDAGTSCITVIKKWTEKVHGEYRDYKENFSIQKEIIIVDGDLVVL